MSWDGGGFGGVPGFSFDSDAAGFNGVQNGGAGDSGVSGGTSGGYGYSTTDEVGNTTVNGTVVSPQDQAAIALSDPAAAAALGFQSAQGAAPNAVDIYSDAGNYGNFDVQVPVSRGGVAGFIDSLLGIDRSQTSFRDGSYGPVEGRFDFFNSPALGIIASLINPALGAAYGIGRGFANGDPIGGVLGAAGLVGNLAAPFSNITAALGAAQGLNSLYGMVNNGQTFTAGLSEDYGFDMDFSSDGAGSWSDPGDAFPGDAVSVSMDQQDFATSPAAMGTMTPSMPSGGATQNPSTSDPGTQAFLSPGLRRSTYGNIQTGDTAPSDEGATNRGYAARNMGRWRQASSQLAA